MLDVRRLVLLRELSIRGTIAAVAETVNSGQHETGHNSLDNHGPNGNPGGNCESLRSRGDSRGVLLCHEPHSRPGLQLYRELRPTITHGPHQHPNALAVTTAGHETSTTAAKSKMRA